MRCTWVKELGSEDASWCVSLICYHVRISRHGIDLICLNHGQIQIWLTVLLWVKHILCLFLLSCRGVVQVLHIWRWWSRFTFLLRWNCLFTLAIDSRVLTISALVVDKLLIVSFYELGWVVARCIQVGLVGLSLATCRSLSIPRDLLVLQILTLGHLGLILFLIRTCIHLLHRSIRFTMRCSNGIVSRALLLSHDLFQVGLDSLWNWWQRLHIIIETFALCLDGLLLHIMPHLLCKHIWIPTMFLLLDSVWCVIVGQGLKLRCFEVLSTADSHRCTRLITCISTDELLVETGRWLLGWCRRLSYMIRVSVLVRVQAWTTMLTCLTTPRALLTIARVAASLRR